MEVQVLIKYEMEVRRSEFRSRPTAMMAAASDERTLSHLGVDGACQWLSITLMA